MKTSTWIMVLAVLLITVLYAPAVSDGAPAARFGDYHVCPAVTGLQPHIGGPISGGATTVLICGQRAARVGDSATCVGPPDQISAGSSTVRIEGEPAARLGDPTAHGGSITQGCPTVRIGG